MNANNDNTLAAAAAKPRKMPADHQWNRGYPNHRKFIELSPRTNLGTTFRRGNTRKAKHGEETKS